ncbi:hypothetical protein D9M68_580570 [compost metagenome]
MTVVDVIAVDVAAHEAQAGHAEGGQVQVIAQLPGAFVGGVEVQHLHRVGEEDRGAALAVEAQIVEGLVAVHPLVGQGQAVRALAVAGRQRPGGVVDLARQPLPLVLGAVEVEVESQGAPGVQVQALAGAGVVLPPDVVEARTIGGEAGAIAGRPTEPGVVDATRFHLGVESL